MTTANAIFNAADLNQDQRLDLNEFQNLVGTNTGLVGSSGSLVGGNVVDLGNVGGYGSSSYQSSSYSSSATGGDLGLVGGTTGLVGGDLSLVGGSAGLVGSSAGLYGGSAGLYGGADLSAANYSTTTQTTAVQQYATDAQGLFQDPNPQVIRRAAISGPQTYTQNIRVRFLQPPPVPPHGPLIIREVRPPQPPVPAPLRIRQQAPPLPTPPPLVLRERPPVAPVPIASQTVVRRLAAIPVPPRSVIIERIPAAPARPRDIVIERWVPYGALAKRRTIVQRAGAAHQYTQPRNIIVQYEQPQVRVVRQFQRLGVTQTNPLAYVQTYGAALLDAQTLVQQARAAGVVEDISAPVVAGLTQVSTAGVADLGLVNAGVTDLGLAGADLGLGLGGGSSYQSSSYSTSGDLTGLGAGLATSGLGLGAGLGGSSSYESSSSSFSTSGLGGVNTTDAAFSAADVNHDGVLTQNEFVAAGY